MEIRKLRKFSKEFKLEVINMVRFGEKSVRELSKKYEKITNLCVHFYEERLFRSLCQIGK